MITISFQIFLAMVQAIVNLNRCGINLETATKIVYDEIKKSISNQ